MEGTVVHIVDLFSYCLFLLSQNFLTQSSRIALSMWWFSSITLDNKIKQWFRKYGTKSVWEIVHYQSDKSLWNKDTSIVEKSSSDYPQHT